LYKGERGDHSKHQGGRAPKHPAFQGGIPRRPPFWEMHSHTGDMFPACFPKRREWENVSPGTPNSTKHGKQGGTPPTQGDMSPRNTSNMSSCHHSYRNQPIWIGSPPIGPKPIPNSNQQVRFILLTLKIVLWEFQSQGF
jgi:hypothetical protein